jgi:hypothetical protein
LNCLAENNAAKLTTMNKTMFIDNTLPTAQWFVNQQPINNNSYVGGNIELKIQGSDNNGVSQITLQSSLPELLPYLGTTQSDSLTVQIPTKNLFGSQVTNMPLTAYLTDVAGNQRQLSITLIADNRGPQFTHVVPSNNPGTNPIAHGIISIEAIVGCNLNIDSLTVTALLAEGNVEIPDNNLNQLQFIGSFNSQNYIDQNAVLLVHAVDSGGNQNSTTIPIAINNNLFDTIKNLNVNHGTLNDSSIDFANNYLLISDLNADGFPDISFGRQSLTPFPNNFFTTLTPMQQNLSLTGNWFDHLPSNPPYFGSSWPWGHDRTLVSCDFNGDGTLDVGWVSNQLSGDLTTWVQIAYGPITSTGQFAGFAQYYFSEETPKVFSCGDINHDGRAEFFYRNVITYLLPTYQRFYVGGISGSYLIVGNLNDIDGDGIDDLAVVNTSTQNFQVLYGPISTSGGGIFSPPYSRNPNSTAADTMIQAIGDLNGDGYNDVALPDFTGPQPSPVNNSVRIFWGNGSKTIPMISTTFLHPLMAQGFTLMSQTEHGMRAGDFNGDGKRDLAVYAQNSTNGAKEIIVFLGPDLQQYYRLSAPNYLQSSANFAAVLQAADLANNGRDALVVLVNNAYSTGEGEILIYSDQQP